ncbi:hypothetical protein NQZ68_026475 [Dissostichus eleginoides]|nr:hypothetical protein NQZ68_026475 [Dissostichus eleginoides]
MAQSWKPNDNQKVVKMLTHRSEDWKFGEREGGLSSATDWLDEVDSFAAIDELHE